ncbi:MAG: FAD-binding oxidoreductase [archaeon]|nr:FAD-binding oxidoreductase [archaeon]
MPFSDEAYNEFENIVGQDNISRDPGILDSYSGHATYRGIPAPGYVKSVWWNRASCVIIPKNTEEIQKVVEICNKHKIKFKAHSTGQYPGAFPQDQDGITIDLRRLNRIIEINKDHMYALVEPYVTQAELLIECMKHGLAPHMIDAGASISPLASHTSVAGNGDSSVFRGHSARNCLGVEWVLPNGELANLGSPDVSNSGWFSGDGPGPSLIGAIRGMFGAFGVRGVFTKAAIKLYPWHGPKKFELGGKPPFYDIKQWPNSKVFLIKWDDYDREADGLYLIGEAEILDSFGRLSTTKTEAILGTTKTEWARIRRSGYIQDMFPKAGWFGHIVSSNKAHYDYCVDVLIAIAEKTGAIIIDPDSDPEFINRNNKLTKPLDYFIPTEFDTPAFRIGLQQGLFQMIVHKNFTLKACEMPSSGTNGPLPVSIYLTIDKLLECLKEIQAPSKRKFQKLGKFLDDGPDGSWCTIDEGGHIFQYMNFTRSEPLDPNNEHLGLILETAQLTGSTGIPLLRSLPAADKIPIWAKYIGAFEDSIDPNTLRDMFMMEGLSWFLYGNHA